MVGGQTPAIGIAVQHTCFTLLAEHIGRTGEQDKLIKPQGLTEGKAGAKLPPYIERKAVEFGTA